MCVRACIRRACIGRVRSHNIINIKYTHTDAATARIISITRRVLYILLLSKIRSRVIRLLYAHFMQITFLEQYLYHSINYFSLGNKEEYNVYINY